MSNQTLFYISHLHIPLKRKVETKLNEVNCTFKPTFSNEIYEAISNRMKRVFLRLGEYPRTFIDNWSVQQSPGIIVYASNGEDFVGLDAKKKKEITESMLDSYVRSGKNVLYYGLILFSNFEVFITKKRSIEFKNQGIVHSFPEFDEKVISALKYNPLSDKSRVIGVNNNYLMNMCPKHIQAIDTLISGRQLFNADGALIKDDALMTIRRIVGVLDRPGLVKISGASELRENDAFVTFSKATLQLTNRVNEINLQNKIITFAKKNKIKIITDSDISEYRLYTVNKSYRVYSYAKFNEMKFTKDDVELKINVFRTLCLTSFGSLDIQSDFFDSFIRLTKGTPVSRTISDSLVITSLKLEKTFLSNSDMGLITIAPKGSYKSTLIQLIIKYYPEVNLIDSDIYGKWVTLMISRKKTKADTLVSLSEVYKLESETSSYFEVLADLIVNNDTMNFQEQLSKFGAEYSLIVGDLITGVANFQNVAYEYFNSSKILLFMHSTVEANVMSGRWQQIIIRPIHSCEVIVNVRKREMTEANNFLLHAYMQMTPMSNRSCLNWIEFILLLFPKVFEHLRNLKDDN